MKKLISIILIQVLFIMPALALDLESTVNDSSRKNYTRTQQKTVTKTTPKTVSPSSTTIKQINSTVQSQNTETTPQTPVSKQVIEKTVLPAVPALPQKANSSTAAHINTLYSGKCPNSDAIIPCTNIKVGDLIIDESVIKSKPAVADSTKTKQTVSYQPTKKQLSKVNYRYVKIPAGTQIRAVNAAKITDYMYAGQKIVFLTTQEIYTPYFRIPAKTRFTAQIVNSHRPQLSCNGGLVAFKITSAQINGYNQPVNGGIVRMKTDKIHFSNLKGEHTYWKTTCKKAKWGQKKFNQWAKTSSKLASKGPAVILSPFPYLGGCVLACASTVSSPVTALLGKGGSLTIPANTAFTIKLYDDAKIRY